MQDVNHQLFIESVLDEVLLSMGREEVPAAEKILRSLDLLELKEFHPMSLSSGQKQRVDSVGTGFREGVHRVRRAYERAWRRTYAAGSGLHTFAEKAGQERDDSHA